jgi:hypothetical protein
MFAYSWVLLVGDSVNLRSRYCKDLSEKAGESKVKLVPVLNG